MIVRLNGEEVILYRCLTEGCSLFGGGHPRLKGGGYGRPHCPRCKNDLVYDTEDPPTVTIEQFASLKPQ
jgi:hypothetical protein